MDLVIANPPYIPLEAYLSVAPEARDHDPTLALFSGHDGLDAIKVVTGWQSGCCARPVGWRWSTPTCRVSRHRGWSPPLARSPLFAIT